MKHYLVPTDFSETAEKAIDFAIHLAEQTSAQITLLHSFEVQDGSYVDYFGFSKDFNNSVIHEAKKKLLGIREELPKELPIEVKVSVEPLFVAITKFAEDHQVDLIIMGTIGASGIKKKLWGSRTGAIIGETTMPVLAIPHGYEYKKPARLMLSSKKFESNTDLLDPLFELAATFSADVFTAVYSDTKKGETADILRNKRKIEEYGEFLKHNYKDIQSEPYHLSGDKLSDSLEEFIAAHDIDLLAMLTHKRGFLGNLFNPSKTKQMSFQIKIPLLAIPVPSE